MPNMVCSQRVSMKGLVAHTRALADRADVPIQLVTCAVCGVAATRNNSGIKDLMYVCNGQHKRKKHGEL